MNRKVKNATPKEYNGIQFKSSSEVMVYRTLLSFGFNVQYEPIKYSVWKGFKPTVPFYRPSKDGGVLKPDVSKLVDITYTPDFVFLAPDERTTVIIEVKGFSNDVYPYKRKLFREFLEKSSQVSECSIVYFEIHNKRQLLQAIDIINTKYEKEPSRINQRASELST